VLLSMTGYGDARRQDERVSVAVEVKSVNSRYLKVAVKSPDAFASFEIEIEKLVRTAITRGTASVTVRADAIGGRNQYRIDGSVLRDYLRQLNEAVESIPSAGKIEVGGLLALPDVVREVEGLGGDRDAHWRLIREALVESLESLRAFRATEGESMRRDLHVNCGIIANELQLVAKRAPQVVRDYRDRLLDRLRELLTETNVDVQGDDLIREVSIYADRCDINEEITRLRSHLEQFEAFLNDEASQGRKLEFLCQEMFREINTIGSKANNVGIAHNVVEMKSAIEKMREILQNVE